MKQNFALQAKLIDGHIERSVAPITFFQQIVCPMIGPYYNTVTDPRYYHGLTTKGHTANPQIPLAKFEYGGLSPVSGMININQATI